MPKYVPRVSRLLYFQFVPVEVGVVGRSEDYIPHLHCLEGDDALPDEHEV